MKIKLSYEGSWQKYITYLIVLISLFLTFFSCLKASFGIECILLTFAILLLNFSTRHIKELLPFIIVCGFVIIEYMFSGQTTVRGFNAPVNHMLKFVYLMFTVAISIGMQELKIKARAKAIKYMLISVIVSVIVSAYNATFVDRYAIRYSVDRGFTNVVDFGQFYGICFILCALVFVIMRYRNQYSIWKYVLLCIPILYCIGISLFVTGVLITALGIGLDLAVHKFDSSKTKATIWLMVLIAIFSLVLIFGTQISDWIYEVTEPLNWILKDRLRSVADRLFFTNHNLIYSYDRRDELAGYSLSTFAQHPILGIGYRDYGYGVIGSHQEWQDLLGVFGIVGALVVTLCFVYLIRVTVKNIDSKTDLHNFYISIFLFFILGFLNPCLNLPVLMAVFVIAPNLSLIIPWWKE